MIVDGIFCIKIVVKNIVLYIMYIDNMKFKV